MPVPSVCCYKPWQFLCCAVGSHEPSSKGFIWRSHMETLCEEAIWISRGLEIECREGPRWIQPFCSPCQSIRHLREAIICSSLIISHCKCLRDYNEDQQRAHPAEAGKHRILRVESVFLRHCFEVVFPFSDWASLLHHLWSQLGYDKAFP